MDNPHYVTPEEAEEMGCPMSMNRPEFAAACFGKTCMAWRWAEINDPQLKEGQWDDATPDNGSKVGSHWDGRNGTARPTAIAGWCGHEICLSIFHERVL